MRFLQRHKPIVAHIYIYMGALLFSLVVLIQSLVTNGHGSQGIRTDFVVIFITNYLLWALFIDWLYGFSKRFGTKATVDGKWIATIVSEAFVIVAIHLVVSNSVYFAFIFATTETPMDEAVNSFVQIIPRALASRVLDVIVIVLILKIIDAFKTSQARKLELASVESQLNDAKLRSLKAQLNPHFLFNSLHAMHTLIGHDNEKAKSMLIKMSGLLRKMLIQRDSHEVTLAEELDYLEDYLAIEKERFHDRLTLKISIDLNTRALKVPSLMLQPIAENAFKHGISHIEGAGIISVSSKLINGYLVIEMSNTIPSKENKTTMNSTKLGLANLKNRLIGLYGENQSLEIIKSDQLFTVRISIKQPSL